MTEVIYDPLAFDRAQAEEGARVAEARAEIRAMRIAQREAAEREHLERTQALAEEGLRRIGGAAATDTLKIVTLRHSTGHNTTLPDKLFSI